MKIYQKKVSYFFHFKDKKFTLEIYTASPEYTENDVKEFVNFIKMSKILPKSQIQVMTGDKYAKLEKAKFLLEQEGYDLENMLFEFSRGKNEIDCLLRSAQQFRSVNSSGASKILQKMLKKLNSEDFSFNYDSLLKALGCLKFFLKGIIK